MRRPPRQGLQEPAHPPPVDQPPRLPQVAGEQVEGADGGGERLRAADPDLQAAARVDDAVREARRLAADDVADGDLRRSLPLRLFHRRQRVDGLARLSHGDDQRVWPDDRPAIAVLGGVVYLRRYPGYPLDVVTPDHRRVEACPHAYKDHAAGGRRTPPGPRGG